MTPPPSLPLPPVDFSISLCYRPEIIPLVTAFVENAARLFGASPAELSQLALAAEEAAAHIIERYPGNGLSERFEITASAADHGLRVTFGNLGLPVDPLRQPSFQTDRPEETIDGLGLFLIRRMVDQCEFINLGRHGWRTVIFKRLQHFRPLPDSRGPGALDAPPPSEKLTALRATLEHVPGIVELAYLNYGYTYSKDLFYFADPLRDALAAGRIESLIACNPAGRVVGHFALFRSSPDADIGEVGGVMIHPDYRRSTGLLQLIKLAIANIQKRPGAPLLLESNLVTTHTLSQKVCALFRFHPMALKVSVHDRARFRKLAEQDDGQRESLLHAVRSNRPLPPLRLFTPPRHAAFSQRLFSLAGIPADFSSPPLPPPPITTLDVETRPDNALAILSLRVPGDDFAAVLRPRLFNLETEGIKTVFLRFPGWLPLPARLEDETRALRIFFCGWIAESPSRWWLLYAHLSSQRFDFNRVQVCDPVALELRSYVETCFQEAVL